MVVSICPGCAVWGCEAHSCAITFERVTDVDRGSTSVEQCDCSVELSCGGWLPPAVQCAGITASNPRDTADAVLRRHTWSRDADPVCVVCDIRFDDIAQRDVNQTPACRPVLTPAQIFRGARPCPLPALKRL